MGIKFTHGYEDIISVENLLAAWKEFVCGKRKKKDVQKFELRLMDHIFSLYSDLKEKTYIHGEYHAFNISDPKPRNIHKASVRDRLLHHAIYRKLYPFFDRTFIADSYSCRVGKGTHKAMDRFQKFYWKVSKNNTRTAWVLKCDVRKFFASIDQVVLLDILKEYVTDKNISWLLERVIRSFHSSEVGIGLPLGNLTSQLFVNVYMNEFDQFMKHKLKVKYYIRYADDFVLQSHSRIDLEELKTKIHTFLETRLQLKLHPDKVFIKTFASGVDFLGWVYFPDHRILRTATKRRMLKRLTLSAKSDSIASYSGMLKYGNSAKVRASIESIAKRFHEREWN